MMEMLLQVIYDSWGNHNVYNYSTDNIGDVNRFRYRSYYYDTETNLYYLNSRYYSPVLKRFLNSDGIIGANRDMLSYNLFAYCSNNPIQYSDEYGRLLDNAKKFLKGVGKTIGKVGKTVVDIVKVGATIVGNGLVEGGKKITRAGINVASSVYRFFKGGESIAVDFMKHSLKDNPSNLHYSDDSYVTEKIRHDSDFKSKVCEVVKTQNGHVTVSNEYFEFNTDRDLYLSFHGAFISIDGVVTNGMGKLNVQVYDLYDFKHDKVERFSDIVNNIANYYEGTAINNYEIFVDMEYNYWIGNC